MRRTLWRYAVLLPVYLLTAMLPLAVKIGTNLEYEYALMAAYAALILLPLTALLLPTAYIPHSGKNYTPPYAGEVFWIFLISPLFGLAPGALLFASNMCQCSAPGFGFWMLVLWYPAWVLAHAAMHAVLRARCLGLGRGSILLALLTIVLAALAQAAYVLWTSPQKHLLHPLFGFWHGPVYDQFIGVDDGMLVARSAHLALACVVLFAAWLHRRFVSILALGVALAAWVTATTFARDYPSTRNGQDILAKLLPDRLEGNGFTLHYQQRPAAAAAVAVTSAPARAIPLDIARVFREAEFHTSELTSLLGSGEAGALPHVQIYVYPSKDDKKLWFGAGATDVTDVYTPSVHITAETWPHPTLRHELVHALASAHGYHGIGFHPNMAFTEGLAVALAPGTATLSLDDASADLLLSGRLPPLETLFSPSFWSVSGERAYTVAGSFLSYLIAEKGMPRVLALYAGKPWEEALGASRDELSGRWREQVTKNYDPHTNALYTAALFSDPGLFQDRCPHTKADLAADRSSNFETRMRQKIGWDPQHDYLPYLAHLDPHDREVQARMLRDKARVLASERFPSTDKLRQLHDEVAQTRRQPAQSLADIELGITDADLTRLLGDGQGSVKILEELAEQGRQRFLGNSLTRDLAARLGVEHALALTSPASALEWRRYLAGWRKSLPTPRLDMHGEPWLLTYLKVRNERETTLNAGAISRLLTELVPDPSLPTTFHVEWYRLLAERCMSLGAFAEAAVAYDKTAAVAPSASRELYQQYGRRARYYAQKGPLLAAGGGSGEKR